MKHTIKNILAAVLSVLVILNMPLTAFAGGTATEKEEVVYANLNNNGSVEGVYVVNILNPDGAGTISDYGKYSEVRNMTTTDKLIINGESITADTNAAKLYYEGTLQKAELPWDIDIKYFLDSKEYTAEDITGKDGKLEIKISITENKEANSTFFENYALQAAISLDTKICRNIKAEGASMANVGADKLLTYTILPGKGKEFSVTSEVTDFEMDSIAVNGLKLALDINVDDSELTDKLTDLQDGVKKLDDGAKDLKSGISDLKTSVRDNMNSGVNELSDGNQELVDGAAKLRDGAAELSDGALTLSDGAAELNDGINTLNDGILELRDGLDKLDDKSPELVDGSGKVLDALEEIQEALSGVSFSSDDITELTDASSQIKAGISSLSDGAENLKTACSYAAFESTMDANGLDLDALKSGTQSALGSMDTSNPLYPILYGNLSALSATESYFDKLEDGADELYDGSAALQSSYTEFDSAIQGLAGTLGDMLDKMGELSEGINKLVKEYKKLDSGISDYTDGVSKIASAYQKMVDGSKSLVEGSADLSDGSRDLYEGSAELADKTIDLYDGAVKLNDGNTELKDGVTELEDGIGKLFDGSTEMADGTQEFSDKTKDMDSQVDEKINDMLGELTGSGGEIISFVSDKNTNVKAVQFVIKTKAIEIKEAEPAAPAAKKTLAWWQKLLKLFGID